MPLEYWRALVFFFTLKGLKPKETEKELREVHKKDAPAYSTVAKWASEWKRGTTSIQDAPRSGRPADARTTDNINRVKNLIEKDRRLTIEQVSKMTKISYGTVQSILHGDLGLSKLSACWVPKTLSNFQKTDRVRISRRNLDRMKSNPEKFFDRIVTQDEAWVHHFDRESKQRSIEWTRKESQAPRKFKAAKRSNKVMASIFWDCHGIIMIDYLEKGKTVSGKYYADELVRLRECIKKKRRGKPTKGVLLLHDNASAHRALVAEDSARNCGFEILEHPANSPDLAPSDFYLFPGMKKELQGQVFASNDEVMDAVEDCFEGKEEQYFKSGIYKLRDRWSKCVEIEGDYVDK